MMLLVGFHNAEGDLVVRQISPNGSAGWVPHSIVGVRSLNLQVQFDNAIKSEDRRVYVRYVGPEAPSTVSFHTAKSGRPIDTLKIDAELNAAELVTPDYEKWYAVAIKNETVAYLYPILEDADYEMVGYALVNWSAHKPASPSA